MRDLAPQTQPSPASLPPKKTRQKRFAPKSKTGCLTCRIRRVKCDEVRPVCHRCHSARFSCTYKPTALRKPHHPIPILPQPLITPAPCTISPTNRQIDIFKLFTTSVVSFISGDFNHRFWHSDVPRAAHIHPSIWHASLALASIHHCVHSTPSQTIRASQYQMALEHFNKSLRHVGQTVSQCAADNSPPTYIQKEMILLANIMYIGISGLLGDEAQLTQHRLNLVKLLNHWRFGDEAPASRKGVTTYSDLISILLLIDGDVAANSIDRRQRPWALRVPRYERFTSTTQAYTALLPILFCSLNYNDHHFDPDFNKPGRSALRESQLAEYSRKLIALEGDPRLVTTCDTGPLATIRTISQVLHLQASLALQTSRGGFIKVQNKLYDIVDQIATTMPETSASQQKEPPFINFSLRSFCVIRLILDHLADGRTRRRALGLMRQRTYKHVGESSHELLAKYVAKFELEASGPERTRPWQRAGIPVEPTFPGRDVWFDGCAGCECIPDVFVCRDHRFRELKVVTEGGRRVVLLRGAYESRHDLPWMRVYLDEPPDLVM